MVRWEPNARGRLEQAAMDLYLERGFEQTTVADIARRAGLTERTFFRHFTDKREVLFWGARAFEALVVQAVLDAPARLPALDVVAAGLEAAAALLQERREFALQRQQVIVANTELRERELIKLATLGAAVAEALRQRGVGEPSASLSAEAGIAVFRVAFDRWIDEGQARELASVIRENLAALRTALAEPAAFAPREPKVAPF